MGEVGYIIGIVAGGVGRFGNGEDWWFRLKC